MRVEHHGSSNILRLPAVKKVSGHERSQIYALMAEVEFPRPVRLSEQSVGWFEDEIEEWQQSRPRAKAGGRRVIASGAGFPRLKPPEAITMTDFSVDPFRLGGLGYLSIKSRHPPWPR